jgi:hypothetical protein
MGLSPSQDTPLFETCLAIDRSPVASRASTPRIVFFPLAIGPALGPAPDRTRGPALAAMPGGWLTPAQGCSAGWRVAFIRSGADCRPLAQTQARPDVVAQGGRLGLGPWPAHEPDHQYTVRSNGRMLPHIASVFCVLPTTRRLCFTPLHGASPSRAVGVSPWPCWAWHRCA